MPRFVLLRHACPPQAAQPSHWDLMLERDGILMTWRLLELPAAWIEGVDPSGDTPIAAERIADHRLAYLTYEGPVSGNRGHVTRIDQGEYDVIEETPVTFRLRLRGAQVKGVASLPNAPPPPARA